MNTQLQSKGKLNTDTTGRGTSLPDDGDEEVLLQTHQLLKRKWQPVIIQCLLDEGQLGFNDLETVIDGISSKVLSENLDGLEEQKLLERNIINEKPVRVSYELTDRGKSLEPVLTEMQEWGRTYLDTGSS